MTTAVKRCELMFNCRFMLQKFNNEYSHLTLYRGNAILNCQDVQIKNNKKIINAQILKVKYI